VVLVVVRIALTRTAWHLHHAQSGTERISAGMDVRTVADRLGHGGGGATTLRVYAAWVAEADHRSAAKLAGRMPSKPPQALRTPAPSAPDQVVDDQVVRHLMEPFAT
jgi:hypothetical protein